MIFLKVLSHDHSLTENIIVINIIIIKLNIMKTSFAVAVLLGLVLHPSKTNAVSRHHHYAPHSHQYIQSRDIDELDMA